MNQAHQTLFQVRDYELDMQGVVNNSVYGNYFEHARHEFLLSKNVNFAALANEGIHLVVTRIEIDYKKSLTSGSHFVVQTTATKASKIKFQFEQSIVDANNTLFAKALVTGVAVNASSGRPMALPDLNGIFAE